MALFRLIHASDLHLAQVAERLHPYDHPEGTRLRAVLNNFISAPLSQFYKLSSHSTDVALAFADRVAHWPHALDGVIITGDIASTGSAADLTAAADYFHGRAPEQWERRLPAALCSLVRNPHGAPLMLMPGNHDRYGDRPMYYPGSPWFEALFGVQWNLRTGARVGAHAHHRAVRTTVLFKGDVALAVCRADFSLTDSNQSDLSPLDYMGQGRVCTRADGDPALSALGELVEQTRAFRRHHGAQAPVIWGIHFPPAHPDIKRPLRLIDDEYLLAAAREEGIRLILSGHTHALACYQARGGDTKVICCGSTTCTSRTNGNVFLDLLVDSDDPGNPVITVYQWDPSTTAKEFVEVPWAWAARAAG